MADAPYADTYWEWEWWRRERWLPSFREERGTLRARAVADLLNEGGGERVLDATCGLGRKSLFLADQGLLVTGTDGSAYAVAHARELAADQGYDTEFLVSTWRELPEHVATLYDAAYVDAFVDCLEAEADLGAALEGICAVLRPGGVFIFVGPAPGENTDEILEHAWDHGGREPQVAWRHTDGEITCTCLNLHSRGDGYLDSHYLYLIEQEGRAPELEHAALRRWFHWDWDTVEGAARQAGFARVEHRRFACVPGGEAFPRPVAIK
jgi:SAM-dependent methyltransferase